MPITLNGDTGIDLPVALPVSEGGTGLTSVGTSGQVLTSNGTGFAMQDLPAGGVTSLNGQTGAITNTDYGSIGSYVIASITFSGSATINADTTVAGSTLNRTNYASAGATNTSRPLNAQSAVLVSVSPSLQSSLGLSGTWRAMTSGMNSLAANAQAPLILWVRIS